MFTKLKQTIKNLGRLGPILAFAVIAPGVGVFILAASSSYWFEPFKNLQTGLLPTFILLTILLVGLSLLPTHAASLISGILFGAVYGPVYAVTSIVLASILAFIIVKILLKQKSIELFSMKPKAEAVYKELLNHNGWRSFYIIVLIRLSPIMPFAGTNVLLAAGKVKLREYILGSAVGLAPRIIIVAMAGAGLTKLDLSQGSHQGLLVLGIVATVLAVAVMGALAKRALRKVQTEEL